MTTNPRNTDKPGFMMPESFDFGIADRHKDDEKSTESSSAPEGFSEYSKDAVCKHEWYEHEEQFQTLKSEGKTVWRCRHCADITNTYAWQKPG
jgi:hypothetical protein